jgi:ubiquitin-protein ligase
MGGKNGRICCCAVPFLYDRWAPAHTISHVFQRIRELMADPARADRDECGGGPEGAQRKFWHERSEFERIAREWTESFAGAPAGTA